MEWERLLGLVLALVVTSGCTTARDTLAPGVMTRPMVLQADSNVIRFSLRRRPEQISADSQARIAGVVATLRAEPTLLTIRVGDTVSVQARLRIIALDREGADLGEIHGYDFSPRGPLWLVRDGRIWAREIGVAEFRANFPRRLWTGDPAKLPSVVVPIAISATGSTSPPIEPRGGRHD